MACWLVWLLLMGDNALRSRLCSRSWLPLVIAVVALFLLVGVSIGLIGGGGSILTVPLLVYGLGLDAKAAVATSLFVVAVSSASALVPYLRRGLVDARVALLFGPVSMLGAFAGGALARHLSSALLLGLFAGMMLATSAAMLFRSTIDPVLRPPASAGMRAFALAVEGAGVGVLTGLVGAGGGFMVVPALVLLAGLDMRRAVGTSLAIISLKSLAGLLGHLSHASVDWSFGLTIAGAAAVGALAGGLLSSKITGARLRRGFGAFVAGAGVLVLGAQIPPLRGSASADTGEAAQ